MGPATRASRSETRFPLDGDSVSARVLRTGRAARMDGYDGVPGVIAATLRELGIRSAVGVPVSVTGGLGA